MHATAQVAHVDLPAIDDTSALVRRLNGRLPEDIRIRRIRPAAPGFDARFSALSRRYAYRVTDGVPDPLRRADTVVHPRALDLVRMGEAMPGLLGEHDFAAFCRSRAGGTTRRILLSSSVARRAGVVTFHLQADAFCHGMVRSLVGALLAVGDGRRPVDWPTRLLSAGRRDPHCPVAPARGLTLVAVRYPPAAGLAERARATRRPRRAPDGTGG